MISDNILKKIVRGSNYAVWIVLILIIGFIAITELEINPLIQTANAETDEENKNKLIKLANMISDLNDVKNQLNYFVEIEDDKTISVCDKAPMFINMSTAIAVLVEKYEIPVLDSNQYFLLAKLVGIGYLLDCTSHDYQENHDMIGLVLQKESLKKEYETKYGMLNQ